MQPNPLANVSLQQLKQAVAIREKIETLEQELSRIIVGGSSGVKKAATPGKGKMSAAARAKISAAMKARWAKRKGPRRISGLVAGKAKGRSRGAPLKERIIQSLVAAGKSGVTVKDLAAKLGKSYGNVSVWFHTTAKGMQEIKKVEPGRFAWRA
jgi:transposase